MSAKYGKTYSLSCWLTELVAIAQRPDHRVALVEAVPPQYAEEHLDILVRVTGVHVQIVSDVVRRTLWQVDGEVVLGSFFALGQGLDLPDLCHDLVRGRVDRSRSKLSATGHDEISLGKSIGGGALGFFGTVDLQQPRPKMVELPAVKVANDVAVAGICFSPAGEWAAALVFKGFLEPEGNCLVGLLPLAWAIGAISRGS